MATHLNASKKRKISESSSSKGMNKDVKVRRFQDKWTDLYFFVNFKEKPLCLLCLESLSVLKECNVKRHYDSKHAATMDGIQGKMRAEKVEDLKRKLHSQQNTLRKPTGEAEAVVQVSCVLAQKIAAKSRPFADGEFIKECMDAAVKILCPSQASLFSKISLSRQTITRRIEDLAENIENALKKATSDFVFYSVAFDESTDMSDTAQLAIFIRGVDSNFVVTEEMLRLYPMTGTTKGTDISKAVKDTLVDRFSLSLKNLSGIATDGAPSMTGRKEGAVTLLRNEALKSGVTHTILHYHCIIHQDHLCAASIRTSTVMKDVTKIVNLIRSRGLKHRQFQAFLQEMDADYGDLPYYSHVRWLSCGKVLKRVFDLRDEIKEFMKIKEIPASHFDDPAWVADLAYLSDITAHMNALNVRLQGKHNLIHNLFDQVTAFERKLELWNQQVKERNFAHFPSLKQCAPVNTDKYCSSLSTLQSEFNARFQDFRSSENMMRIFSSPFTVEIATAPIELQMELIDLQSHSELLNRFRDVGLLDFYARYVDEDNFPLLRNHALRMVSLFASTYVCEQFFSRMKITKSKMRTSMTDQHLENSLRIATSQIEPDIEYLVSSKQCQKSH